MNTPQKRRLSVGSLRKPDLELGVPQVCDHCHNDLHTRETCEGCGGEGMVEVVYEISSELPVDTMVRLLDIHERLVDAGKGANKEEDVKRSLVALDDANDLILEQVRDRYPDARLPRFSLDEVIGILSFMVGNPEGPIGEVEEALALGQPPMTEAEREARIQEEVERRVARARGEEVEDPPTSIPPESDSSIHSSPSGRTTNGDLGGGEDSPGRTSEPTASASTE